MARKTITKTNNKNPQPKRTIDDNFVAPKIKAPKVKPVTLAEALAESGETMDDLRAPPEGERPVRPVGSSNLATTIRGRRKSYAVALHPNGKKTQNNGDQIAQLLLLIPLEALRELAGTRFEGKTYEHLNPGHARMCIGNLIRAASKKDEAILHWLYTNQPKAEGTEE